MSSCPIASGGSDGSISGSIHVTGSPSAGSARPRSTRRRARCFPASVFTRSTARRVASTGACHPHQWSTTQPWTLRCSSNARTRRTSHDTRRDIRGVGARGRPLVGMGKAGVVCAPRPSRPSFHSRRRSTWTGRAEPMVNPPWSWISLMRRVLSLDCTWRNSAIALSPSTTRVPHRTRPLLAGRSSMWSRSWRDSSAGPSDSRGSRCRQRRLPLFCSTIDDGTATRLRRRPVFSTTVPSASRRIFHQPAGCWLTASGVSCSSRSAPRSPKRISPTRSSGGRRRGSDPGCQSQHAGSCEVHYRSKTYHVSANLAARPRHDGPASQPARRIRRFAAGAVGGLIEAPSSAAVRRASPGSRDTCREDRTSEARGAGMTL